MSKSGAFLNGAWRSIARRLFWLGTFGPAFWLGCAPVHAADVFNGKELYARHCTGCHGASGDGMMPGMPNFSLGERMTSTNRELVDSIRQGNGVMPGFGGMLDDEQISDIVAYLRTLL